MKFKNIIAIVSAALICMGCPGDSTDSSNSTEDSLIGIWYKQDNYGTCSIYEFVNENTVKIYWMTNDPSVTYFDASPISYPKGGGWYYWPQYIKTWTYVKQDNKIIITDGTILTISGKTLIKDGEPGEYRKWVENTEEAFDPDITGYSNGHAYVDLGLSVNWAIMNIGASSVSDYGNYFAWGETTTKSTYDWSTYKWCEGSKDTMTKYCTNSSYGTVDNKTVLDPEDDAAHVNWGDIWRMPTYDELNELNTKCTWEGTTYKWSEGYKVTGPNGNSIFLPAAGAHSAYSNTVGGRGDYWSSSLKTDNSTEGWRLYFWPRSGVFMGNVSRYSGISVRAVCSKNGGGSNNDGNNGNEPTVIPPNEPTVIPPTEPTVSSPTGYNNSHAYVDLGLSVKWATMNIGASSVSDYGNYYAWGETMPKDIYHGWDNYKWCKGSSYTMTKYCSNSSYGTVDNKTVLDLSDDAARANWGGTWRMPTYDELNELNTKCTWTWTTQNGVNGRLVTGPNGNSIFLPAAGYRNSSSLTSAGSVGNYWSSSLYTDNPLLGWSLFFNSSNFYMYNYCNRYYGRSVRAVCP